MLDARPLRGLRVLDLTRLLPGPYLSLVLADLGADVVKIEPPQGDWLRWLPSRRKGGPSAEYIALNRGKRSLAIDLKRPEGPAVLRRLIADADVMLESFRPGVMARLGLGWDVLHAENPRLCYVAITGYGQTGPYAQRAGHDLNYVALSGALDTRGTSGAAPAPSGYQLADIGGALFGAVGVLAGVHAARETGVGRFIDVSLAEAATAFNVLGLAAGLDGGKWPLRGTGLLGGGSPSYDSYETADGEHMTLAAIEPKFWKAFCEAVQRPDWLRLQHSQPDALRSELRTLFRSRTRAEWESVFAGADACVEPVLHADELPAHPQHSARALFFEMSQHSETVQQLRTPLGSATHLAGIGPAPKLGEHTRDVLLEAGYTSSEIDALCTDRVVTPADG